MTSVYLIFFIQANISMQKTQSITFSLWELETLDLGIHTPALIFLYGTLGAGKTTLSASILRKALWDPQKYITSPTYTYYQRYKEHTHFDLYRLQNYDEFVAIWGEEIVDNSQGIILIEWPEILEGYYTPNYSFYLEALEGKEDERLLRIISH